MLFNEKTRVQIPAIMHLVTLGYEYISLKDYKYDKNNNIVDEILFDSLKRINPSISDSELLLEIDSVKALLKNDDLGKAFYNRIIKREGIRFIDFNDYNNNSFNVVYEFPFINIGEEFRPDITVLINGMPLSIAEVKIPNNRELIESERIRMKERSSKSWFKQFINGFQLLIFSNNMKYDDESIVPIQGAFYSTTSKGNIRFSTFREEDKYLYEKTKLRDLDSTIEKQILQDTNSVSIKGTSEYITNLSPDSPTNSMLTSLLSKERIMYLLNYGICYVEEKNEETGKQELKKHIMRYPQLFASKAIVEKIDEGLKKGIIWHTQGSGKTELSYYMNKILVDYFANQNSNVKLFFIVDRIDLFRQASSEFNNRGLHVNTVNSRSAFEQIIKSGKVLHNKSGKPEITVVNIQKFSEDSIAMKTNEYDTNMQRVYIIDESHRSYSADRKDGLVVISKFLMQLIQSDKNAIHIGLTGTPIILEKVNTTDLFGGYFHKYYYNQSIADGYTLRLFREEVLPTFVHSMKGKFDEYKIRDDKIKSSDILSKPNFVFDLVNYIIEDYQNFDLLHQNPNEKLKFGAMIVCDSNAQAREIKKQLDERYGIYNSLLILHDENTKDYRDQEIKKFKNTSKYNFLIVDRMLLTGFDSRRLKRMYLLKVIRKHGLLQALTRVNRPFQNFKYGYIVDFADISEEFKKTNDSYLEELKKEYGDEFFDNSDIFITNEEIISRINLIKEKLFNYDTNNIEIFSKQMQDIEDINELRQLSKIIDEAKNIYNVAKLSDQLQSYDLSIDKINKMAMEIQRSLSALLFKESLNETRNYDNLIDATLEQIKFAFFKVSEGELKLGDQFFSKFEKTREHFRKNIDKGDPKYSELISRLRLILDNRNIEEITEEKLIELEKLENEIKKLNNDNLGIISKYNNDVKYLRIHKRLKEKFEQLEDYKLSMVLSKIKEFFDNVIYENERLLENEHLIKGKLFEQVYAEFIKNNIDLGESLIDSINLIDSIIYTEYINERRGYEYARI